VNVERLHAIAKALSAELSQTALVDKVASLQSALSNQVNSPQEPSYQQAVATARQGLEQVLATAPSNDFPATWRQAIEELGVDQLLGSALLARMEEIFNRNQITMSVARDDVVMLATQVSEFWTGLEALMIGFAYFDIGAEELKPGEAEVGVMIPRAEVKDELEALGEEFEELQKILGPFIELTEGSRPQLTVRSIASSDFTVYVAMAPGAALSVATALDKILDVYRKILDMRASHADLVEKGVPPEVLAPLVEHANGRMAAETERIANEMVDASASVTDAGRANELKIELRLSLNSLANRIDRGYNVDVRAEPEPEPEPPAEGETGPTDALAAAADAAVRDALQRIVGLQPKLAFVNRTGKPILSLPEGETIHEEADETGPPAAKP
jgi:hypothetical protein